MRQVPQSITDAWLGGEFTGNRRPMARVTLQRLNVNLQKVDATRLFASAIFNQADIPREMPNVKSVEWERSLGSDVATCTIVFYNTTPLPLGRQPVSGGDFDLPGWYTFNYGATSWSGPRWGQQQPAKDGWQDYLVPDRILRTYEGYGFDRSIAPEKDPHLVQTGLWLIDDVEYTHDGLITVTCRDLGRLLLDHIMFPPVIPLANYPLIWEPEHSEPNPDVVSTVGITYRPTYITDSNVPYVGKNGLVHGHRPAQAFDTSDTTFWMSIGNSLPNAGYSYEYIEGGCGGKTLSSVTVKVYGGPYRAYLSVKIKGAYTGRAKIPYDPSDPISAPNGADINYCMVATVGREGTYTFKLAHPVSGVEAVRVTFTGLFNSGIGPYKYRAGVRSLVCAGQSTVTKPGGTHIVGNYADYTDIVKYLLACGGFHWPKPAAVAYLTNSDATKTSIVAAADDPVLKSGRIWGDLEDSHTKAISDSDKLGAETWDKKPLMDGIAYVRDLLGFVFFIDETGGAIFRMPNVITLGNYVGNNAVDAGYKTPAQKPIIVIDEKQTLLGLRAKISSRNIREHVFVADTTGKFGAVSPGFNPIKPNPGLRRVGGWTDSHWKDLDEAQRMADLITMRQAFAYRNDTLTITANPAIQIDDQIRLYERVTGEGFYHYVKSIKSSNDLEEGRWTYDLTTNWLGEDPLTRWAFDATQLKAATQMYLDTLLANRKTS